MKFFNVRVYREGDTIQIRFDSLEIDETTSWSSHYNDETIKGTMLKKFNYPDRDKMVASLQRKVIVDNLRFNAQFNNKAVTVLGGSSTYQLPVDPVLALDFLSAYKSHLTDRNFNQTSFHNFSISAFLIDGDNGKTLPGTLEQYLSTGITGTGWSGAAYSLADKALSYVGMGSTANVASDLLKTLVERILNVAATMPNYTATFNVVNKVYQFHAQTPAAQFKECLDVPQRYGILCDIPFPTPAQANTSNSAAAIERYVQTIGKKLASENRIQELNHLIDNYQLNLKVALNEPAIGQLADDGGKYNWSYTEWQLLRDAQFTIRPDGKVGIQVANNKGYLEHYAPGCRNHDILEREMRYLGKVIGLEFEPETDFHKEIIFNDVTSQRLIASGIHLNSDCLKNMLQPKSVGLFFKQDAAVVEPAVTPALQKQTIR